MIQNEQAPHEKVPSVSMLLDLGHFLSLGCGLGLIRFAPGTFGALLGIVMYLPLSTLPTSNYVSVCLTLFILGVAVCHRTSQTLGGKDHGSIVWDETVGMLMTFLLMFLRTRFLWWPLHPVGYALSMNFGIDYIWSCLIFSSIIKRIILSYGGVGTYRRAIPFFLGVILGEYVIGGFWSLIGVILQYKTYDFYFA